MDVILKEDIKNLGYANEMVKVKDGYARNYLIPKGLAAVATASAKKVLEENVRQRAHKEEKIKNEAEALADKLEKLMIKIPAKVGEQGKIFGSINNIMLADAMAAEGLGVERKNITLIGEGIKEVGEYEAEIDLHREVKRTIKFEVVAE